VLGEDHSARLSRGVADHSALRGALCQHRGVRPTLPIVDDHRALRTVATALLEAKG
jgi:hypothetical protein